ncbi:MAG TPA: nitronate monooxygenase [Gemmatimonadaceae bacterium]|nr:nitronate monooxygenase [Gemmatimonadaceae bacterium]
MTTTEKLPLVIQGGMGVAVSNWRLAKAVSTTGNLGVVSGTMLDTVMVRRLQDGDPGGDVRRAISHFPIEGAGEEILRRYYRKDGRGDAPYHLLPMYKQVVTPARQRVTILANFVEVFLAKEGHDGVVGINLLTKVQMPTLPSLYGAMLAGVDYVIMGAGIPREIPGALDALAEHKPAKLRFDIEGLPRDEEAWLHFDPADYDAPRTPLKRPRFLAVVSASSLATTLARKANGRVDGFVIERPSAGGHNAPPRGEVKLNDLGEPMYGDRDIVDLAKIRELGLPFWLAGGAGSPEVLREALDAGAAGIQVGTLFAFCEESGVTPEIRREVLHAVHADEASVFTDPRASPTGYPFKVVRTSNPEPMPARERICDLGYLRVAARTPEGRVVYRCSAEPVDTYVAKGGTEADAQGRRCLCNGLTATVGMGQQREPRNEDPLVTSGDDLINMPGFFSHGKPFHAADVIAYLLSEVPAHAS